MAKKKKRTARNLMNTQTGERVAVDAVKMTQPEARAGSVSVRRPSPGISVASTLSPARLAGCT